MTKARAFLIRSLKSLTLTVFMALGGTPLAHPAIPATPPNGSGCQEAVAAAQRYGFYEGLAVLAESNLEKFFIPQYRLAVHRQILREDESPTFPHSIWWIPEGQTMSYTLEPTVENPTEGEMKQIMTFRQVGPANMSDEQLATHLALEKKLHLALYQVHQDGLMAYREWAFGTFPPLRAYQRVFENYLSSSVWWNNYVSEYARTLAGIYHEQNFRSGCPPEMLWTSLDH